MTTETPTAAQIAAAAASARREVLARIEAAYRATQRGPWYQHNPTATVREHDINGSGGASAHRCTTDQPPIDETHWMETGRIRDTSGNRYTLNGQPLNTNPDILLDDGFIDALFSGHP